jgi:asparagine synthase (glutamine-hydrolysing)
MCGVIGIITKDPVELEPIAGMNATLVHRGPDDSGLLLLPNEGVGLAMRRLSILDLAGGHQPMWDEEQECAVVFNGEIYNFAELREELTTLGHRFRTSHSDTEVLVHGYQQWGLDLFERLNGMFAFVIWDRRRRQLVVARDRAGEKPLYLARLPQGFAVASELKAIMYHPAVRRQLDLVALEQYLSFDFIMSARSILTDVQKLPAGHFAVVTPQSARSQPYWSIRFDDDSAAGTQGFVDQFDMVLDQAVRSRMVADVPVGVFLSGGLDSTTIAYYMSRHSAHVHSFSIAFEEPEFDESRYAFLAADHLATAHHLEVFSEDRVQDLVPKVAEMLDEPMADQSIFPTYLLSRFARESVKVALGGDGSDELLMGYRTYQALKIAWHLDWLPKPMRLAIAATASRLPQRLGGLPLKGRRFAERLTLPPVGRLLCSLGSFNGDCRWVLSEDVRAQLSLSAFDEPIAYLQGDAGLNGRVENATIAAYVRGYLQEDILVKVDRASMAASLEVRSPFLDPNVIAFLGSVPPSLKLRRLTGKYLLRQLMRGRIPDVIINRPKHGFGVPLGSWMRGALGPILRDYLSLERLKARGIFDGKVVNDLVDEHISGTADNGQLLWPLLLFEMWKERWLDSSESRQCGKEV